MGRFFYDTDVQGPTSPRASSCGHSIGRRLWRSGNIRAHCGSGDHCCGYAITHLDSDFDSQGHGHSDADQDPGA